ncbi:MAG: phosphoribosylamine--glycine ligase [Puniceicoccaceae bacterium]
MPKVLLIGSGAREHALAHALLASKTTRLSCFGSSRNPGILPFCEEVQIGNLTDASAVAQFARGCQPDLAIIGPEAPLAAGVADALWTAGVPTFGPTSPLARIESSKSYARQLMLSHKIPGLPRFKAFRSLDQVDAFLEDLGDQYVVKADGLMGGKGVKVSQEHLQSRAQALQWCEEIIAQGGSFLLEEKCLGPEFSLFTLSDGRTVLHLPPVQDHKRALPGDLGPNTGGMGSYTDCAGTLPFLQPEDLEAAKSINQLALQALQEETEHPYQGVLYGGFMATAAGVRVIEFNARFGDPEVINLLALLEDDLTPIIEACVYGNLAQFSPRFSSQASVCKYLVPHGYPDSPKRGFPIDLGQLTASHGCFLGAVEENQGTITATGSRSLALVATAPTVPEASEKVEEMVQQITGDLFHRPDIGTSGLLQDRIQLMDTVRSSSGRTAG